LKPPTQIRFNPQGVKKEIPMLDIEYVVVDGPYARRKFWENQIIVGTTQDPIVLPVAVRSSDMKAG
jgi:hypothetical protein